MNIGDKVVDRNSTGVIVGMSTSGDWVVEWTYGNVKSNDPELCRCTDSELIVISNEEDLESDSKELPNEALQDLLDAVDSLDIWWHQQEGKISKSLVHDRLCEALTAYYKSMDANPHF